MFITEEKEKEKEKYFLHPGCIFISKEPHLISTVLGSCVSVCIWDDNLKIGAMNHHIFAKPFRTERNSQFGIIAIPYMIKLLLGIGATKSNLRSHIVGGAQNPCMESITIGKDNIRIAEEILRRNGIKIFTRDTGGEMGRKVIFDSETGEIVIYKVNRIRKCDWHGDN